MTAAPTPGPANAPGYAWQVDLPIVPNPVYRTAEQGVERDPRYSAGSERARWRMYSSTSSNERNTAMADSHGGHGGSKGGSAWPVFLGGIFLGILLLILFSHLSVKVAFVGTDGSSTSSAGSLAEKEGSCFRSTNMGRDRNGVLMTPIEPVDCAE